MSYSKICISSYNFEKLLDLSLKNCEFNSQPDTNSNVQLIEQTPNPSCTFTKKNYNSINVYDSKSGATSSVNLYNSDGYCCPISLSSILNENTTPFPNLSNLNSLFTGISKSSLIVVLLGGLKMSTSPPDEDGKIDPSKFNVLGFTTTPLAGYSATIIQNNNPPTTINLNLYVYNNDTGKVQTYSNLQRRIVNVKGKTFYFATIFDQNDRTQNYYRISTPNNGGGVGSLPEILIIGPEISLDCQSGKCKTGGRCLSGNCPDGWGGPNCNFCPGRFSGPTKENNNTCKECSSHFQTLPGDTELCKRCTGNWTKEFCDDCPRNFNNDNGNCDTCLFGWSSTTIDGTTPTPGLKMCNYCSPNYDNSDDLCYPCSGNGDVDNPTLGTCKCYNGWSGDKCETCNPLLFDNTDGTCSKCYNGWYTDFWHPRINPHLFCNLCSKFYDNTDGTCSKCKVGFTGPDCFTCSPIIQIRQLGLGNGFAREVSNTKWVVDFGNSIPIIYNVTDVSLGLGKFSLIDENNNEIFTYTNSDIYKGGIEIISTSDPESNYIPVTYENDRIKQGKIYYTHDILYYGKESPYVYSSERNSVNDVQIYPQVCSP